MAEKKQAAKPATAASAASEKKSKKDKKDPKTANKRGRAEIYQQNAVTAAKYMSMAGMIDIDIAAELQISVRTLNNWKKKYPDLLQSLKVGKFVADGKVIESLFLRATGFEYDEITYNRIETVDDSGTVQETKETEVRRTRKYIPPDVKAITVWLYNRRPEDWRNINHIEHSGRIGGENAEIEKNLENNPEAADALRKLYRLSQPMERTSED